MTNRIVAWKADASDDEKVADLESERELEKDDVGVTGRYV